MLRRGTAAIIAAGVALALPYLLMGPGWLLDDWIFVRNRHFAGLAGTASQPDWLLHASPGAWLIFLVSFGVLHDHPAMLYVVQAAVTVETAVMLFRLLARFVPVGHAWAVAAVWLLLPIRSATDHWAAALNISVAVLLLVVGVDALAARRWVRAGALLLAGTLCYEVVLPAALLAVGVAWWRSRVPALVWAAAWLVVTGAWMLAATPKSLDAAMFDFATLPAGHFGAAAFGGAVVLGAGLVVVGALLGVHARSIEARMLLVGVAVILVGMAPFARFPIQLLGIGDRVNAVASIGTALVVASAFLSVTGRRVIIAVIGAAVLMVPVRLERDSEYAWAATQSLELAESPARGDVVVLGACPVYRHYVTGLQGYWDATPAVQFLHDNPTLLGRYTHDAPMGVWSPGEECERQRS